MPGCGPAGIDADHDAGHQVIVFLIPFCVSFDMFFCNGIHIDRIAKFSGRVCADPDGVHFFQLAVFVVFEFCIMLARKKTAKIVHHPAFERIGRLERVLRFHVNNELSGPAGIWKRRFEQNVEYDFSFLHRAVFLVDSCDAWHRIVMHRHFADAGHAFDIQFFDILRGQIFVFGNTACQDPGKDLPVGKQLFA